MVPRGGFRFANSGTLAMHTFLIHRQHSLEVIPNNTDQTRLATFEFASGSITARIRICTDSEIPEMLIKSLHRAVASWLCLTLWSKRWLTCSKHSHAAHYCHSHCWRGRQSPSRSSLNYPISPPIQRSFTEARSSPSLIASTRQRMELLEIDVYASGSLGKSYAGQMQLLLDGVADLAYVNPALTPERVS